MLLVNICVVCIVILCPVSTALSMTIGFCNTSAVKGLFYYGVC